MMHLSGTWYNEWGSQIVLSIAKDGRLAGHYTTHVGNAEGNFQVIGLADHCAMDNSRSLGLVVAWNNEHIDMRSVTTWSGQYQVIDGEESLVMTWLMTRETRPQDDWLSTFVGSDVFHREKPSINRVQRPTPYPT